MRRDRTNVPTIGEDVSARVERIFPFGVFVRLKSGTEAYIRRKELTQAGNLDPYEAVSVGDTVHAKVIQHAKSDRLMELSVRQAEPDPWSSFLRQHRVKDTVKGTVKTVMANGVQVQVRPGVDGFVPLRELAPWRVQDPGDLFWIGDKVEAMITSLSPARWMHLSIRQEMKKAAGEQQRLREVKAELRDRGIIADAEPADQPESLEIEARQVIPLADLEVLGPILVLDDHYDVVQELISWLQMHGGLPDGVGGADEGLEQAEQMPYELALVDPDLTQKNGLAFLRDLKKMREQIHILIMSTPEWIDEQSKELEKLRVAHAFAKPLDLDEVLEILTGLAKGESVGPFRVTLSEEDDAVAASFQHLAEKMRSGVPVEARLLAALAELVRLARAELGALFHLDPVSKQVSILAQTGSRRLDPGAVTDLSASPVKDLIVERRDEFETSISSDGKQGRFKNLLDAVPFESCLGVPVSAEGRVEHALFLFHTWPNAFDRELLRDAHATATLLSVALDSQALEAQLAAVGPFLLNGQLASAFGHDVANKMDVLELQVRNLKGRYRELTASAETDPQARVGANTELTDKLEQLLENTIDLKSTAHAFGELLRADQRGHVDVNEALRLASRLLGIATPRERLRIWLDLALDLPPVVASPVRLRQVFLNVMLNAIQQIMLKLERWPQGWGELTISTSVDPEAEGQVHVRFADSGPGIHRRLWDQIFALGYSTRPGGSGLGLFIARSLVESMGGTLCVEESTIPAGTVFRVELPAAHHLRISLQEVPGD